jgi:hypothetical protein
MASAMTEPSMAQSIPLGHTAALRISAFDVGQDGKGRYVTLNRNLGRVDEYGVRGKLLWQPHDDLEVILAGEYTHHYDTSVRTAVGGPAGTSFAPTAAVTAAQIAHGVTPGRRMSIRPMVSSARSTPPTRADRCMSPINLATTR